MTDAKQTCLIVGAGIGVGSGLARAFAEEGLSVCMTRRARNLDELEELADQIRIAGGEAHSFGVDARNEEEMTALVDRIEKEIGPIEVAIFNIGANVNFPILDTTARVYRKVWEMAALAGFFTGREAARVMIPRERGTIIFTGATASIRGGVGFSAFAGAKHALRALAQSMARELGPKGIHVAHTVIDGSVDGVFARERYSDIEEKLERNEILHPDDIARSYVSLWKQPKSAWSHELDLRPWTESF